MIKNLVVVGNSLAVVIDKPTRRFLNIGRHTKVRVTTEPRRLIIEPIPETPQVPASELDALPVFNTLVNRFAMTQERFGRLHHQTMRMFAYHGWLVSGLARTTDDEERATLRRFYACLRALMEKASWDDAIAIALDAEPKPGTASGDGPTSESSGATTAPTTEGMTKPTLEATTKPTLEATTTPTLKATTTPTLDSTTKPTSRPTFLEATTKPTSKPTLEATTKATSATLDASVDDANVVPDASVYAEVDDEPPNDGVEVSWG